MACCPLRLLPQTGQELAAGPAFFLNSNIALETVLFYARQKTKDDDALKSFGLKIGFQIYLNANAAAKK